MKHHSPTQSDLTTCLCIVRVISAEGIDETLEHTKTHLLNTIYLKRKNIIHTIIYKLLHFHFQECLTSTCFLRNSQTVLAR